MALLIKKNTFADQNNNSADHFTNSRFDSHILIRTLIFHLLIKIQRDLNFEPLPWGLGPVP